MAVTLMDQKNLGNEGVTFILISNGGPIDLNWSDIKSPPLI
jgi:hypothetical protein